MGTQPVKSLKVNPAKELPLKISGRLILSVDDEETILSTREIILQHEGYRVLSAADGEEALKLFETHAVELVLLDYYMPGIDGGMVAAALKKCKPGVPIIMVSASLDLSNRARVSVDAFIAKGDGPGLLMERIRELLAPKILPGRRAA